MKVLHPSERPKQAIYITPPDSWPVFVARAELKRREFYRDYKTQEQFEPAQVTEIWAYAQKLAEKYNLPVCPHVNWFILSKIPVEAGAEELR